MGEKTETRTPPCDDSGELKVGAYVIVDKDKKGIVKFLGENKYTKEFFGPGEKVGVHLVEERGTMNGTYKNEKFFRCPDGHGVMVKKARIKKVLKSAEVDFDFSSWDAFLAEEEKKEAYIAKAKENVAKLKASFAKIDEDHSRLISKDEFVNYMLKAHPELGSKEDLEAMFNQIDTTKSDSISLAEYEGWLQKEVDAGRGDKLL